VRTLYSADEEGQHPDSGPNSAATLLDPSGENAS
jgi:hypothetical protein